MDKIFLLKIWAAMSVPLIICALLKDVQIFKKNPKFLSCVIAVPSIYAAYLFLG